MEFTVNYLAILAVAVFAMVLGSIWYGPLFGKKWMKLSGVSPDKEESMIKGYVINFVTVLVTAYVFAMVADLLGLDTRNEGLMLGFWLWLGFVATHSLGDNIWGGKPYKLWVLNNGYNVVLYLFMGWLLVMWK